MLTQGASSQFATIPSLQLRDTSNQPDHHRCYSRNLFPNFALVHQSPSIHRKFEFMSKHESVTVLYKVVNSGSDPNNDLYNAFRMPLGGGVTLKTVKQ